MMKSDPSSNSHAPRKRPQLPNGGVPRWLLPLLAVCFALGLAVSSYAGGYCAIAYSESTGRDGYSDGYDNRRAAEEKALEECGTDDAKVVIWRHNGYIALARGAGQSWGAAGGDTREAAERKAKAECPSDEARIVRWAYSFD